MNKTVGRIKKSTAVNKTERLTKVSVSIEGQSVPRLPHEHDQSADNQGGKKRKIIQQAGTDIKRGLRDTDRGDKSNRTYQKLK